jgi:peroxiredoxin
MLVAALLVGVLAKLEVGYTIPGNIELHANGFPPTTVNLADRLKGKNVILVGLPGAFTPT